MPAEKITISGYGRFVDALLDELGVGGAAVVGNSMGGFIGIELAIRFPERVERLVLVERGGAVDRVPAQRARCSRLLGALDNRLAAYTGWLASRSDALARRPGSRRLIFGVVAHHPERLPAPLVAEQVRGSGKPGFVPALDALTDYPIRDRLGEIACPTLIVWGAEDRLVPARDADEFARLIPNARKVVWPDTGHVAMLERPAAFNALLEAFLDEEPGERVGAARRRAPAPRVAEATRGASPRVAVLSASVTAPSEALPTSARVLAPARRCGRRWAAARRPRRGARSRRRRGRRPCVASRRRS